MDCTYVESRPWIVRMLSAEHGFMQSADCAAQCVDSSCFASAILRLPITCAIWRLYKRHCGNLTSIIQINIVYRRSGFDCVVKRL